jgi:predicted HTH transcriptional regulator
MDEITLPESTLPETLPSAAVENKKESEEAGVKEAGEVQSGIGVPPKYDDDARVRAIAARRKKREDKLQLILAYVAEHGSIVNDEIQEVAGLADQSAYNYAKLLVKRGELKILGTGVGTRYVLPQRSSA